MISHNEMDFPECEPKTSGRDLNRELKELEVAAKRQELAAKTEELRKNRSRLTQWNNPISLAILAALIGYLGTVVTWYLTQKGEETRHQETLQLEERRQVAMTLL